MEVKVALIQDGPVLFDKEASFQKLEQLTEIYANQGCELIVFPETFIPGYPRGFTFGAKVGSRTDEGRAQYQNYYNSCVDLQGEDLDRLEQLSEKLGVYLVVGITERQSSNGSLYCSMVYVSPTDGFLGVHRKIKPTGTERVIWDEADGESLVTFQTRIGKLGGLICWENYMPLARMSMYQKGVEIYIAPTADARPEWISTMQHIALEGRCFVLGCNQFVTRSMYPSEYQSLLSEEPEIICRGGSVIVSPLGKIIAGPLYDKAGAVIASIDLDDLIKSKLDFDASGHYNRKDIFRFKVEGQPEIHIEKDLLERNTSGEKK